MNVSTIYTLVEDFKSFSVLETAAFKVLILCMHM